MRSRIFQFFLMLALCGVSINAQEPPAHATLEAEIEAMLEDKHAFPEGSEQHKALEELHHKLPSLMAVHEEAHNGHEEGMEHHGEEGMEHHGEEGMEHQNESNAAHSGSNYAAKMRHHRALVAEHAKITALHETLNTKMAELKQLRETIQKHHNNIHGGAEVEKEYNDALTKYENISHEFEQMHTQYKEALNQYNEHRQAYQENLGH